MSALLFADDVIFLQRLLRSAKCYEGECSGVWDGATDAAERDFFRKCDAIADVAGACDPRSERNIRTLHPKAQEAARNFLKRLQSAGIEARIISGTRSYAEQDALYRQGRFRDKRPRVTNAKGGQSNHNFGIAWDIGIFRGGAYLPESPDYERAAQVGVNDQLEWGGNWASIKDRPHYQLKTTLPLNEVRRRFEAGEQFV